MTIVPMPCILVAVMVIRMVRNTRVQSGRHASIIDLDSSDEFIEFDSYIVPESIDGVALSS